LFDALDVDVREAKGTVDPEEMARGLLRTVT
jgi:hypothetical protein